MSAHRYYWLPRELCCAAKRRLFEGIVWHSRPPVVEIENRASRNNDADLAVAVDDVLARPYRAWLADRMEPGCPIQFDLIAVVSVSDEQVRTAILRWFLRTPQVTVVAGNG
jgi:hypothetical protein